MRSGQRQRGHTDPHVTAAKRSGNAVWQRGGLNLCDQLCVYLLLLSVPRLLSHTAHAVPRLTALAHSACCFSIPLQLGTSRSPSLAASFAAMAASSKATKAELAEAKQELETGPVVTREKPFERPG